MITRHIVINVAAALAILSVSTVASAQGASGKGRGQGEKGGQKAKAGDADKPGPALSGTSTEAAAQEEAAAKPKAQAIPDVAPNTPAARFGAKGQVAISSDVGLTIENTSVSGVDGSTTTVRLHPAIDYFVIDNLSIGGFLGLDYISTPGGSSTAFSIGPRVGYNITFADRFSVWPKAGISVSSTSQSADVVNPTGGTTSVDTSNTAVAVNLFVPVVFHPVEHFFIGFGPVLDADLSGDNKSTTFGGRLTIGGWF
jgi:hypothetical protein